MIVQNYLLFNNEYMSLELGHNQVYRTSKGEEVPQPRVAVLGKGFAGLLSAYHLAQSIDKPEQIAIIGSDRQGASGISSWFVAQRDPEAIEDQLVRFLGKYISEERLAIAHHLAHHHLIETEKFKDILKVATGQGINECVEGYSGVKELTGFTPERHWAGKSILEFLLNENKKRGVHILTGSVADISASDKGYNVFVEDSRGRTFPLKTENVVIATGGLSSKQENATVPKNDLPDVLELVRRKLGVVLTAMDQAVNFPFAIDQKGYLKRGLLSPRFIRAARILAEDSLGNRTDFLPKSLVECIKTGNYRHIFPQLHSLISEQIRQGKKVLVVTEFDEVEYEQYRTREYYGHIFRGKKLSDVQKGISVTPAYHYTLGGVDVDRNMRSSQEGVYAIGEAAFIFGEGHIMGGEYMATITLAPLLAQSLKKKLGE